MADVSIVLAVTFGILTAVPGLLPAAGTPLVTWSRVVSGIGWLGYGAGLLVAETLPEALLPGILAAQAGYGLAVIAIARQACRDE